MVSSKPPRPHDGLVKFTFSNPAYAAAELRAALPKALGALIRWETLEPIDGSFVDHSLCPTESDLLYRARLGNREALIYLLLEHQSTVDRLMPLRVLGYVVDALQQYAREHPGEPLPVVIPIVLHHSRTGWTAPTTLEPLFGGLVVEHPELRPWVPAFQFVLDDISQLSDAALRAHAQAAFPRLALAALRDARDGRTFLRNLRHWADALDEVVRSPSGKDALAALFRYITEVANVSVDDLQQAVQAASPEAEDAVMTLAEQLIQQGMQQGMQQGLAKGLQLAAVKQRRLLRRLLEVRYGALPAPYLARIDAADDAQIDALADRVTSAETLEALFGA